MRRDSTALHRAAAWCVAVLAFVLLAVGGRRAWRALVPPASVDEVETPRQEAQLVDVADSVADEEPPREQDIDAGAIPGPEWSGRRRSAAALPPLDEPLEKHPAISIEGVVRSATGTYRKRVVLEVVHPGGGIAPTSLHFDRRSPDGVAWVAPFKLVKPAVGTYVLRPEVSESWAYAFEPPELRVSGSLSGVSFLLRDDVEHVDVDVAVLGANGEELDGARWSRVVLPWNAPPLVGWRSEAGELEPGAGPELRRIPVGIALAWFAAAPGHRPALGEVTIAAGQQRLDVRLVAGWGVVLEDWSAASAGLAEVLLDDRSWGWTDPSGTTLVLAEEAPEELQVWIAGRCALRRRQPEGGEVWYFLGSGDYTDLRKPAPPRD